MKKLLFHPWVILVVMLFAGEAAFLTYWQHSQRNSKAAEDEPVLVKQWLKNSESSAEVLLGEFKVRNDAIPSLPATVETSVTAIVDRNKATEFRNLLAIHRARIGEIITTALRDASQFELHERSHLTIKRRIIGGITKRVDGSEDMVEGLVMSDLIVLER